MDSIWHPCSSPTMESQHYPFQRRGKGARDSWGRALHESLRRIQGCVSPITGYCGQVIWDHSPLPGDSSLITGIGIHRQLSSPARTHRSRRPAELSRVGSALPSRWSVECQSGVLCCLQHSTTRQVCLTDTGRNPRLTGCLFLRGNEELYLSPMEWPIKALALQALSIKYICLQPRGDHVEARLWTCVLGDGRWPVRHYSPQWAATGRE